MGRLLPSLTVVVDVVADCGRGSGECDDCAFKTGLSLAMENSERGIMNTSEL